MLKDARNSCGPVHCPDTAKRWAGNSPPVCQVKGVCVCVCVSDVMEQVSTMMKPRF